MRSCVRLALSTSAVADSNVQGLVLDAATAAAARASAAIKPTAMSGRQLDEWTVLMMRLAFGGLEERAESSDKPIGQ
jgi:hypothetical protein